MMMKKATREEALAETAVFWDIKRFPVPPGFDARRVGPCIKRLLAKNGFYGPLSINVVGILTDVHNDILRALFSTGINIYYGPFGSSDIMSVMFRWRCKGPLPTNLLGICSRSGFLPRTRTFNHFGLWLHTSVKQDAISWTSLILDESGALEEEEDTCSEITSCVAASWFCLICHEPLPGQCFESLTRHLSSPKHALKKLYYLPRMKKLNYEGGNPPTIVRKQPENATPEEAVAVTSVFWDMKTFPVPLGFDARLVSPCIKRLLEKYGYSGPLTINAIGILKDVPDDILRGLSSTGINFYHALHGSTDIKSLMSRWISKNPPPANILGICDPRGFPLPLSGYNIFRPFSYSSPQQDAFLWESSLLADSEALTCSETGESASHFCLICNDLL